MVWLSSSETWRRLVKCLESLNDGWWRFLDGCLKLKHFETQNVEGVCGWLEVKSSTEVWGALKFDSEVEHLPLFIGNVCGWLWRENMEDCAKREWLVACLNWDYGGQIWLCSELFCTTYNFYLVLSINLEQTRSKRRLVVDFSFFHC